MLVSRDEPAKAHHPREESLDVPTAAIAAQRATVLRDAHAVRMVRRDHLDAELRELGVERIAVIGLVADQSLRQRLQESLPKGVDDERRFSSLTTRNPDGERKAMAVCHCHDLGRLAASSDSNLKAPLFAPA